MGIPWGRRLPTAVSAASVLSVTLAGCGSANPIAPTPLADAADLQADVPAQQASMRNLTLLANDTLRLNGGTLVVAFRQPGTVELRGSRGFRFDGVTHSTGVDPNSVCQTDSPCIPGQTVLFTGTWAGLDIPGTAGMQGNTYEDVGGLNSESALRIDVSGSFVAPPQASAATVVAPFTVSGVFQSPDGFFDLEGNGRATLTLEWVEGSGITPTWVLREIRFDFGGGGDT